MGAHNLDAQVTEVQEFELLSTLTPSMRHIALGEIDASEFPDKLRAVIAALLLSIEATHRRMLASREADKYWHQKVQRVLGNEPTETGETA